MKEAKERFCFNCGESMGAYADYDRLDNCGARECQRAANEQVVEDRYEAHQNLDREMGWQ